jgi:AcrR family transcriptional regulator
VTPAGGEGPRSDRDRICQALLELVGERGYTALTAAELLERAGVDRATFERHFSDIEDCFAAVWDEVNFEMDQLLFPVVTKPGPWRERARAALEAALRFLAEDDSRACLYVSEAVFGGQALQERRVTALLRTSAMIDLGRAEAPDPERVPSVLADAIAGAIWHRAGYLIRRGQSADLPADLPQLLYLMFLPYLGTEAAQEELRRPAG